MGSTTPPPRIKDTIPPELSRAGYVCLRLKLLHQLQYRNVHRINNLQIDHDHNPYLFIPSSRKKKISGSKREILLHREHSEILKYQS